jgi:enediyne biosynthesis protein E4
MIKIPTWRVLVLAVLCCPAPSFASKPGYPVHLAWTVERPLIAGATGRATLIISTGQPISHVQVAVNAASARARIVGALPEYEGALTPAEPVALPVTFRVPPGAASGLEAEVVVDGRHGTYRLGAALDITPDGTRPGLRPGAPSLEGLGTLEVSARSVSPVLRGAAMAPGDSVTLHGRFAYRDRVFGPNGFLHDLTSDDPVKPIRFASVELQADGVPVATGITDSSGAFSFSILPDPQVTYRARVLSTTGAWGGGALRVRTTSAINGAYYSATTPNETNVTQDVDWGDQVVEPGAGEGFNLLDCVIEGSRQVALLSGRLPSASLNVYWTATSTVGTYFTLNQSSIYLLADEGYDDCVVLHEFGHFVAAFYSNDDSPGGEHFIDDDQQDVRLAWSEGFATYFQASVRKRLGDPYPSWYVDTWGTPGAGQLYFSYDLESASLTAQGTADNRVTTQGIFVRGTGSEVVVQALLWDILDNAQTPGDGSPGVDDDALDLGPGPSWQVITGPLILADAVSLEDFWDGWFALSLGHQADMEAAFGALGAEYFPDAFEADNTVPQSKPLLADGHAVHHTFYPKGDVDVHSVTLTAGVPVLVETSNILGYGDTFLEITHGDSTWSNDDRSPSEMASAVQFTPPETGEYTIQVARSTNNSQAYITTYGSYDLRAVAGAPQDPLLVAQSGSSAAPDPGFTAGVALADVDQDGLPDLYVVNNPGCGATKGKDGFYRNLGGLNFTNVTAAAGFGVPEGGGAGAWGDYDRDGNPDLFVSDHGLFRNNGDGTFTDVTAASGITDIGRESDAAWVDSDQDGRLDLFVLRRDGPSVLWRNQGDGTFVDATAGTGLVFPADGANAIGCAWGDYDRDGRPDLFIARRSGLAQTLYHNLGGNHFEDVTSAVGLSSDVPASGGVWGDVTGDGLLDLFVSSVGPDRLYIQNGNGTFTERAREFGVDVADYNTGAALFDVDEDGDLDLFVSTYDGPQYLFRNLGGLFVRASDASDRGLGYGVAVGDLDGDGDPDLYQGFGCDAALCLCQNNRLYRNVTSEVHPRHWLGVKLVGDASNLDGIGARVVLHAGTETETREMGTGMGWASKSLLPVLFGLGAEDAVDSLEVFWPSGLRNVSRHPGIDRLMTVIENAHVPVVPPGPDVPFRLTLRGPTPNPFQRGTTLVLELTQGARVDVSIYDVTGRRVRALLDRDLAAGTQYLGWDGTDDLGRPAGRGLYFYRVAAQGRVEVRKLLVVGE